MADTQTHIVYRNRIEHDLYESNLLVPIAGGLAGFIVVFLLYTAITGKVMKGSGDITTWVGIILSALAGIMILQWLII